MWHSSNTWEEDFFPPLAPTLEHRPDFSVSRSFLRTVGLIGRVSSSSEGLYLNRGHHKHRINTYTQQTSMPCVGFESRIPASERGKTVHALDRWATVSGERNNRRSKLQSGRNEMSRQLEVRLQPFSLEPFPFSREIQKYKDWNIVASYGSGCA
jgi:hypothetical protein